VTLQNNRPANGLPTDHVHLHPPAVDNKPPIRSKITAALAGLACAACCALPFLIAAGVLTGAGAAIMENVLLGASGLLVAAAAAMWYLHRRRSARKAAAAGQTGCASGNCAC
jgi:hypothetical protein